MTFYIGIVNHNGTLKAEFGPKKFQREGDTDYPVSNNAYTTLLDDKHLPISIANLAVSMKKDPNFKDRGLEILMEYAVAYEELGMARRALYLGKVTLDDFFLPDPPTPMQGFCSAARASRDFVTALSTQVRGKSNDDVDPEESTIANIFLVSIQKGKQSLADPVNRKSLPKAVLAYYGKSDGDPPSPATQ